MRDIVTVPFSISSAQDLTTPAFGKMRQGGTYTLKRTRVTRERNYDIVFMTAVKKRDRHTERGEEGREGEERGRMGREGWTGDGWGGEE